MSLEQLCITVECQHKKIFLQPSIQHKERDQQLNFHENVIAGFFAVIQRPSHLPMLWWYEYSNCQTIIMFRGNGVTGVGAGSL